MFDWIVNRTVEKVVNAPLQVSDDLQDLEYLQQSLLNAVHIKLVLPRPPAGGHVDLCYHGLLSYLK